MLMLLKRKYSQSGVWALHVPSAWQLLTAAPFSWWPLAHWNCTKSPNRYRRSGAGPASVIEP